MSDDPLRDWLGQTEQNPDPLRAARQASRPALPKRFYAEAGVAAAEDGHRLVLDGRPARTPGRRMLAVPQAAVAQALAEEWGAQGEEIDPARMPLTRLVNTALDGVADRRAAVAEDIAAYAGSDLLAYRAGDPARLVASQSAAWDPVLDWARSELGARFMLAEGVMHVPQPEESLQAVRRAVEAVESPLALTGLHVMTTLTGSVLLALAVLHGRLTAEEAWAAAHVDEIFQASVWGRDEEAEARRALRWEEFAAAARLVALTV
ncbi:ATP12 family chaperone protein [Methylobacterium nodulans]|uniref:ATP12 ATPase n=1 Tax=Methylobacterium nodulans (strain LMG 21967 / CNCM I-2342 / ORS 2060) TaxID=460265 RepID=B8IK76_METNO|nr:ATP12 family protein [Methylobacterium nodulans]ACL61861.1 ATP12 ATPase [Methylobacterium nodulans ORS 2060]